MDVDESVREEVKLGPESSGDVSQEQKIPSRELERKSLDALTVPNFVFSHVRSR
jgi:hypothetical protein